MSSKQRLCQTTYKVKVNTLFLKTLLVCSVVNMNLLSLSADLCPYICVSFDYHSIYATGSGGHHTRLFWDLSRPLLYLLPSTMADFMLSLFNPKPFQSRVASPCAKGVLFLFCPWALPVLSAYDLVGKHGTRSHSRNAVIIADYSLMCPRENTDEDVYFMLWNPKEEI